MERKILGLLVSCLIVISLVLASCGPAAVEEEKVITGKVEEEEAVVEEEVLEEVPEKEMVETSEPEIAAPAPVPYWAEVISWEGSSIKDTETFSIIANEWRILWSTEPGEYGDMNFQIYIYEANGNLKGLAANIIGKGNDVSYIRGAGNYYLTINTGQPYTIIIEQSLEK